jgi:hypothetical protein
MQPKTILETNFIKLFDTNSMNISDLMEDQKKKRKILL